MSEELTITPDIGNIDDKPLSDERTVQDINSTVVLLIDRVWPLAPVVNKTDPAGLKGLSLSL